MLNELRGGYFRYNFAELEPAPSTWAHLCSWSTDSQRNRPQSSRLHRCPSRFRAQNREVQAQIPGIPGKASGVGVSEPAQHFVGITVNATRWICGLGITQSERPELRLHHRHVDRRLQRAIRSRGPLRSISEGDMLSLYLPMAFCRLCKPVGARPSMFRTLSRVNRSVFRTVHCNRRIVLAT